MNTQKIKKFIKWYIILGIIAIFLYLFHPFIMLNLKDVIFLVILIGVVGALIYLLSL